MATRPVDVAIVGGGVAGSSLGVALASAGLGVAIVEREARFRDRVRGEALHPWGAAEAAALGLVGRLRASGGLPLPIWQRYEDRQPVEPYRWVDDVPGGHVEWGVPHAPLQEALLAHAAGRGVLVLRPAVATGIATASGGVEVSVESNRVPVLLRARLLVAADGQRSATRRWLGIAARRDAANHAIAGVLLRGGGLDRDRAHQTYPPGGMVVAFPQDGDRIRLYVVRDESEASSLRGPAGGAAIVEVAAETLPAAALEGVDLAGPSGVFPCGDVWPETGAADRVVLVGDAAGANDPSQGHGLSLAFRDARLLRDLLLDGDDWRAAIEAFTWRRAGYYGTLREHAKWAAMLRIEQGPAADARRERAARAREADPTAGGFAGIFAFGPDGLVADEAARRRFFGEDSATADAA